jgi:16S rRNA (guanine966-N2)-methyltransferase
MRIIAGEHGGRKIKPPVKMPYTRPTTDIAKEGLFNILQHAIQLTGLKTLDLFGGTGSISFELASRGAIDLTVVEKDNRMYDFIRQTAEQLQLENFKVIKTDVFRYISHCGEQFDFIFAGPPYSLDNIDDLPLLVFEKKLLSAGGWFVLEHTQRNDYKKFSFFRNEKKYGTTVFSFFINN